MAEFTKYGGMIEIPKDSLIESGPMPPPNHPIYELMKSNVDENLTAQLFGYKIRERMVIWSPFLGAWIPIGPSTFRDPW